MEADTSKRKRPDVSQRIKDKRNNDEQVVKVSLAGHLNEPKLRKHIESLVESVSKATNRGSLLLNRALIKYLGEGEDLPDLTNSTFFRHCIAINDSNTYKKYPILYSTWKNFFQGFPDIDFEKTSQAISYAALNLQTVFLNSLVYAFESRQKRLVKHWLAENGFDKNDRKTGFAIRCAVNNWTCNHPLPEEALDFVQWQHMVLDPPVDGINKKWLKQHPEQALRYAWFILNHLDGSEHAKSFSIAPILRIKRHFVTIDTTGLFSMMKKAGLVNDDKKVFASMRDEHFQSAFCLTKLFPGVWKEKERMKKGDVFSGKKESRKFGYMVETDGVSLCVHFKKEKTVLKEPDCDVPTKSNSHGRVIAIDPGRTNIVYGIEREGDGYKTYRISKKQYYTDSGIFKRTARAKRWQQTIQDVETVFAQHSPRTVNPNEFDAFIKDYLEVYDELWNEKIKRKWGQSAFRVYRLKQRTLDRFFQTMAGNIKPTIAYGAAKFNPTGKHELSSPTTHVTKCCSKHFPTIMVDEFRTSKVCPCCNGIVSPVKQKQSDLSSVREIRWLRRCSSTECSRTSFLNRDKMAAINILRCFEAGEDRPMQLARNGAGSEKAQAKPFYLPPKLGCRVSP